MGWAGTGVHFDPVIADDAAHWLRHNATGLDQPWFLTVALVNPHDVMWFPIDQPGVPARRPSRPARAGPGAAGRPRSGWTATCCPPTPRTTPRSSTRCPPTSATTSSPSPRATGSGGGTSSTASGAPSSPTTPTPWRRQLDYYVRLHELADRSLGTVLEALEDAGAWDDTIVVFTSDHGDMCGSHGLRSKGPFVYDEIMKVPAVVRAPGLTAAGGHHRRPHQPRRPGPHDLRPGRGGAGRRGCGASTWARCWPTRRPRCATRCCSATPPPTRRTSGRPGGRCGAASTAATSTPATSASAAGYRTTTCPAGRRPCSTAPTPRSRTRSTSSTTCRKTRTSWSTWPWTRRAAPRCERRFADLLALEAAEMG